MVQNSGKEDKTEIPQHKEEKKRHTGGERPFSEEFTMAAREVGDAIRDVGDAFKEALMIVKEEYKKSKGNLADLKDTQDIERVLKRTVRRRLRYQKDLGSKPNETTSSSLNETASFEAYSLYYEKTQQEARRAPGAFGSHLVSFVVINVGLMALNMIVSPTFPWALFPFGGWGIGLLTDLVKVFRKKEKVKELERFPLLAENSLELFKRIQKKKDETAEEVAALIPTGLFLYMINMITSPGFLWSLIPIGFTIIGGVSSFFSKRREIKRLENLLQGTLQNSGMPSRTSINRETRPSREDAFDPYEKIVQDARLLRDAIQEMIQGNDRPQKGKSRTLPGTEELLPLLDLYVEEIASLVDKRREIVTIIETIPFEALERDKMLLKKKLESTETSVLLREECQRALANIEKQERSVQEMQDEKELMEIKIRSSLMALQQMRLDVARLISLAESSQKGPLEQVDRTAEELRRYIQDLKTGYEELNQLENNTKRFLEKKG
ncbi:MAG: 2TM domain-containing protein [Treponemataceae bacterium]|nr:2TM domain-containing protein [Treponemataceae bacterium]